MISRCHSLLRRCCLYLILPFLFTHVHCDNTVCDHTGTAQVLFAQRPPPTASWHGGNKSVASHKSPLFAQGLSCPIYSHEQWTVNSQILAILSLKTISVLVTVSDWIQRTTSDGRVMHVLARIYVILKGTWRPIRISEVYPCVFNQITCYCIHQ